MYFSTSAEWLSWIEKIHIKDIDLGLERVRQVAERLQLKAPACPLIIVGGTNGKGSCVAGLDAIYRVMGYRVGQFTSPYFLHPHEQIKVNGEEISEEALCQALAAVEKKRAATPLTLFEYFTLAAMVYFCQQALDVLILEVGLGGRLDAVNIWDADLSIIASIGIDHIQWLGHTREQIALEKAGIMRSGKPTIYGDLQPPVTLLEYAHKHQVPLFCQGQAFSYQEEENHWSWFSGQTNMSDLPYAILATQNMSIVLMAIDLLKERLPVQRTAIDQGLKSVQLPGRIQSVEQEITEIFDVSHNPDAILFLSKHLKKRKHAGKTYAVFSMLADKDIPGSIEQIHAEIDHWYIAPLTVKRGATKEELQNAFQTAGINTYTLFPSIEEAYQAAKKQAKKGDTLLIFGSFHTLAAVWRHQKVPLAP